MSSSVGPDNAPSVDGNERFLEVCLELDIPVLELVARTARWVDPAVVRALPVWYPAHYRKMPLYKADWTTPQMVSGRRAVETNFKGQLTLDKALGLRGKDRPNWTCCHIWGYSDASFQTRSPTNDPRYYTAVANLVQLPTPLKALTDSMPEVQAAIRACAWNLYGWTPESEDFPDAQAIRDGWVPDDYPVAWPRRDSISGVAPGIVPMNARIRAAVTKRKSEIRANLGRHRQGVLPNYPAEQVESVLGYWGVVLE